MSINNRQLAFLRGLGYTGSINDAYRAYLLAQLGVTTGSIDDLLRYFLRDRWGYRGSIDDMLREHLRYLGYTGSITDMLYAAWGSAGIAGISFSADLKTTVVPNYGTGSATFTRATVATVSDHEGVLRSCLSGEARFQGARRVRNLVSVVGAKSEDYSAGGWTKFGTASVTGTNTINLPANSDRVYTTVSSVVTGDVYVVRAVLSGSGTVKFGFGTAANTLITVTLTSTPTTYSVTHTASGATGVFFLAYRDGTTATEVTANYAQIENVTGQSIQTPGEYVSVGVLSSPFHGAMVDGVKYFTTTNGNTVASNVVTEASGSPISSATLLGYLAEGAGTQLVTPTASIRDMTNAAWVKGATMTAALTGTGVDGVTNSCSRLTGGAVAATNTAFQTLVAAASSRTYSCYIKRVTGTGTINITQDGGSTYTDITSQINSSTFTRVSLNASVLNAAFGVQIVTSGDVILVDFNQFESGTFATSPMASAGAARNADVLTYPFAGNASASVGSAYAEVSTLWSSTPGVTATAISFGASNELMNCGSGSAPTVIRSTDGTTTVTKSSLSSMATAIRKRGLSYGAGGQIITGDGATVATGAFDGDMGSTAIGVGCRTDGAAQWKGTIRNVRIYSSQLSASQLQAVTA
jgi:hypothetical protein